MVEVLCLSGLPPSRQHREDRPPLFPGRAAAPNVRAGSNMLRNPDAVSVAVRVARQIPVIERPVTVLDQAVAGRIGVGSSSFSSATDTLPWLCAAASASLGRGGFSVTSPPQGISSGFGRDPV